MSNKKEKQGKTLLTERRKSKLHRTRKQNIQRRTINNKKQKEGEYKERVKDEKLGERAKMLRTKKQNIYKIV